MTDPIALCFTGLHVALFLALVLLWRLAGETDR